MSRIRLSNPIFVLHFRKKKKFIFVTKRQKMGSVPSILDVTLSRERIVVVTGSNTGIIMIMIIIIIIIIIMSRDITKPTQ